MVLNNRFENFIVLRINLNIHNFKLINAGGYFIFFYVTSQEISRLKLISSFEHEQVIVQYISRNVIKHQCEMSSKLASGLVALNWLH